MPIERRSWNKQLHKWTEGKSAPDPSPSSCSLCRCTPWVQKVTLVLPLPVSFSSSPLTAVWQSLGEGKRQSQSEGAAFMISCGRKWVAIAPPVWPQGEHALLTPCEPLVVCSRRLHQSQLFTHTRITASPVKWTVWCVTAESHNHYGLLWSIIRDATTNTWRDSNTHSHSELATHVQISPLTRRDDSHPSILQVLHTWWPEGHLTSSQLPSCLDSCLQMSYYILTQKH